MKQLFYTLILTIAFINNTYAQLDLTTYVGQAVTDDIIQNNDLNVTYSASVADDYTNLTTLVTGDTLYFHYSLGDIYLNEGDGGSDGKDILMLNLAFAAWKNTLNASYTISSKNEQYSYG